MPGPPKPISMTRACAALHGAMTDVWGRRGPLTWLLWPASLVVHTLVALRANLYRHGWMKTYQLPVPVVVVGSVLVGGSGKTPVVLALVQHLLAQGHRVGVVARGYGRRTIDCREVTPESTSADSGDEPLLIKRTTGIPVFVAHRRADAASSLLARYPQTEVVICDDGLQHLSLRRDLEICVFDDRGTGNGLLLPAGPLREPWPRPAELVLHTGAHPALAGYHATRKLAGHAKRSDGSQVELAQLRGNSSRPLLAVAAIARPTAFFDMLRGQGLVLAETIAFPDHYGFDSWPRKQYEAYEVLCTEKDAVKLWRKHPDALAVPLQLEPEPAFLNHFDRLLWDSAKGRPGSPLSSRHGHTTA